MKLTDHVRRLALLSAGAVALPGSTFAADAPPSPPAATAAPASGDIVVTAQRRRDRLQDIPQAVSAFNQASLQRLSITNTESLVRNVPGLTFTPVGPGEANLGLRGLNTALGLEPTVALYVNDTPFDFRTDNYDGAPTIDLFDLDRVEVLRGPQGTLFGSSSLGGTIRFILKQPEIGEFNYAGEAGMNGVQGGALGYSAKGVVNIPVSPIAALRVVGTYEHIAGYLDRYQATEAGINSNPSTDTLIKRDSNDVDIYSVRATAKIQPVDNLTITPSLFYQKLKANDPIYAQTNLPDLSFASGIGAQPSSTTIVVGNLTVERDFGFANLVSSSSILDKKVKVTRDYSYLPLVFFGDYLPVAALEPSHVRTYTQEIRLSSPSSQRFRWLAGFYYSHTRQTLGEAFVSDAFTQFLTDPANGFGPPSAAPVPAYNYNQVNIDQQISGFGQINFDLTHQLELIGGARVYNLKNSVSTACTDATAASVLCGPPTAPASASATGVSPRATLNFKPNRNMTFYATASRGFRPGGANSVPPAGLGCVLPIASIFKPDTVWNYELGTKLQSPDHKFSLNGAAYQIDQKGVQIAIIDPVCGYVSYANAGNARVKGAELEMSAHPLEAVSLSAQLGYSDAKFTQVPAVFGAAAGYAVGDPVPETPRWKYGASGELTQPITDRWQGYLRGDWQHVGRTPFTTQAGVYSGRYRPAYDIFNFQLGGKRDRFDINLYVHNALNRRAILGIDTDQLNTVPGVFENVTYTMPRTVGVSLQFHD